MSESKSSSYRTAGIVLGAVAAVGAAAGVYWYTRKGTQQYLLPSPPGPKEAAAAPVTEEPKSNESKGKKTKSKPSSPKKKEKSQKKVVKAKDFPTDEELATKVAASLQLLQQTGRVDDASRKLYQMVQKASPKFYSVSTRIDVGFWIVNFCTFDCSVPQGSDADPSQVDLNKILKKQRVYYKRADKFLSFGEDELLNTAASTKYYPVKLEVLKTLKQYEAFNATFNKAMAFVVTNGSAAGDCIVPCLSFAAYLGRWTDLKALASLFPPNVLGILHDTAVQNPGMLLPDFKVLLELLEEKQPEDLALDAVKFATYTYEELKMKFNSVVCDDAAKKEELEADITKSEGMGWQSAPCSGLRAVQNGGIMQMISNVGQPIPLVGLHQDGRIDVQAYYEGQSVTGEASTERITWTLEQSTNDAHLYEGAIRMVSSTSSSELAMVFDVELRLREDTE